MIAFRAVLRPVVPITANAVGCFFAYTFALEEWDLPANRFFLYIVVVMVSAYYLGYIDRHINPESAKPRKKRRRDNPRLPKKLSDDERAEITEIGERKNAPREACKTAGRWR